MPTFGRVLVAALVAALCVTSSAVAGGDEVRATPPSTPLEVRVLAGKAPALNEPLTITLQTSAAESAPGTIVSIELPDGAEVLDGATEERVDLEAGQTHELTVVAALTKLGEQTILGKAVRSLNENESWGDSDALYLTVEKESGFVGHRSAENPELQAVKISDGAGETVDKQRAGAARDSCCIGLPPRVTVRVCWTLDDRDGATIPFRDAIVEFVDEDPFGGDDVLATRALGYLNGCAGATFWSVDYDDADYADVYVRLSLEHPGRYRIQNQAGTVFSCQTATEYEVELSSNHGTWKCGSTAPGAEDIYNDVYRVRRFIEEHRAGKGQPPGNCTVQWETSSTNGTFYSPWDGLVHLKGQDATSRDTVVHECAHRYMHFAYGGWPNVPNCVNHSIQSVSGPECAWTEGYTYVLVAGADGDPSYTWPNNAGSLNLETPNCLSPSWFQAGAQVEGRVGGVLIDLLDVFTLSFGAVNGFGEEFFRVACFGADSETARFADFWAIFSTQNDDVFVAQGSLTNSFSRAWQAAGHTTGPGMVYYVAGQFYFCPAGGNCVGRLNAIPTFAQD